MSENIRIGQDYPCDGTYLQGTSTSNRREYLGDSSDNNSLIEVKGILIREVDHLMKGDIPTEIEDL